MKKIIFFVVPFLLAQTILIAQEKKPVQLIFSFIRTNDSIVNLSVKANIVKGTQLFSIKKRSEDDSFVSSLFFDSNAVRFQKISDTSTEIGNLLLVPEAINSVSKYRIYEDSVTFLFPLHLKANDSVVIKGTFNWLGKSGDQFPSGEISFYFYHLRIHHFT